MGRRNVKGTCYLIHFVTPYHHARHYLGWTEDALELRIGRHREGRGSRLMEVVMAAGIDWVLARTWLNTTRADERRLKNRGGSARHCPLCQKERNGAR